MGFCGRVLLYSFDVDIGEVNIHISLSHYLIISSQISDSRNWGIESSLLLAVRFAYIRDIASANFAHIKSPKEEPSGLALIIVRMVFSTSRSLAIGALILDLVILGSQGVVGTFQN